MVQEKELRSGNLVYRIIEDYEPLAEKKVVEWGWDIVYRIGDCVDREENYEYIVLTAEKLKEFGFEKGKRGINEYYYIDDFEIQIHGDKFPLAIWGGESAPHLTQYIGLRTKYVHQLQNLYFALKGKELERKTI